MTTALYDALRELRHALLVAFVGLFGAGYLDQEANKRVIPAALDASVEQLQGLLRCLEPDRAAVRDLLPSGDPEPYPTATAVVAAALDDFLGEPGVGTGVYGHLCNFVHPGLPGSAMLFSAGLATGEPNIKLADYCLPVSAACHGMIHAVNRLAKYLDLVSPDPYTAPIQDVLAAVFDLPRETLLRRLS